MLEIRFSSNFIADKFLFVPAQESFGKKEERPRIQKPQTFQLLGDSNYLTYRIFFVCSDTKNFLSAESERTLSFRHAFFVPENCCPLPACFNPAAGGEKCAAFIGSGHSLDAVCVRPPAAQAKTFPAEKNSIARNQEFHPDPSGTRIL